MAIINISPNFAFDSANLPDILAAIETFIGPQNGGETDAAYFKRWARTVLIGRIARLRQEAAARPIVEDNSLIT